MYCTVHLALVMQYESAVGVTYAWVYFLLVVIVGSVFILNLWIGVLTRYLLSGNDYNNNIMMPSDIVSNPISTATYSRTP